MQPGLRYRGEIKYILISDINEKRFHKVRTGESIKLLPGHWKFPVFDARRRALDAKLVDSLFEKSLPFDSDVFDDSGSPESSSSSQPSSASQPSASLPLPVPSVGQGSAPTNPERLPPGPVGRPALNRPPHWSTTDELKKQWSNFSKTKREKLTAEYRNSENARLAAEQLSSALLCILSGTAPTPPATACASVPLSTPTDADEPPPQFYKQPAEESHVNHYAEVPPIWAALVTKNLTRRDAQWHEPGAVAARNKERDKLIVNKSWSLTPSEQDDVKLAVPTAMFTDVFTLTGLKHSEDADKVSFKARSVARGSVVRDADNQPIVFGSEVAAHATSMSGLTNVQTYGAFTQTSSSTTDAVSAFTQPRFDLSDPAQQWFARLPPELLTPEQIELCRKLKRPVFQLYVPLYGIPPAPAIWKQHLENVLLKKCSPPWEPIEDWPQSYARSVPGERFKQFLSFYVDDGVMSGPNQTEAWNELRKHLCLSDAEPVSRLLGTNFTQHSAAADEIHLTREMNDFFSQAVQQYESIADAPKLSKHSVPTPFVDPDPELEKAPGTLAPHALSLVMKLLYGARMSGIHLMFAVCNLAGCVSRWTAQNDKDLCRLISYVKWTPFALVSKVKPSELDQLEVHGYPDADFAGSRHTAKSISGGVAGIATPGSWVPTDWECRRQTATATSTTEAETISLTSIAKKVIPLQTLWSTLLNRPVRARYFEDNMSTITVIKTGFSIAMRHLAKHHRVSLSFAHEVTSNEHHASIEHVATTLQKGDLLTKALDRVSFERGLELNGIVCLSKTKS